MGLINKIMSIYKLINFYKSQNYTFLECCQLAYAVDHSEPNQNTSQFKENN